MKIQSELDEYVALAAVLTVIRDRASRAAQRHGTSYGDAYATSFADVASTAESELMKIAGNMSTLRRRWQCVCASM